MEYPIERTVYLDPDFISSLFEQETGISPTTQFSKTQGMNAGAGIPFFNAGLNSQETKTYSVSLISMYQKIKERLSEYPSFKEASPVPYPTFWVDGRITVGEWKPKIDGDKICKFFEMKASGMNISLLVNYEYFYHGVGSVHNLTPALQNHFKIQARMLCRTLYSISDRPGYVVRPYIIQDCTEG